MGEKKNKTGGRGHQALYRKYRSRSLSEIKGQEHITKTLASALKQEKISHAYLFTGPRGTGKTSIARILAHEINNLTYNEDAAHLDIIEIDAASNRRIDDIRDLRDKVNIAPVSAKYKVFIIDEVHMLTTESFNALLKTLEEPPEHVVFILATTEVHKLPATIISRTQRHSFRLIATEKIIEHLAYIAKNEGISIEPEALELLAQHGGGSFRDSISLLDQLGSSEETITTELIELLLGVAPQEALKKLLEASMRGEAAELLELIDELIASGLTPSGIASQLADLIKEEIKTKNSTNLVSALEGLISVHGAQYPRLKLETALLSIAPAATPIMQTANRDPVRLVKSSPETAPEPSPRQPEEKESKAKEPKVKPQPPAEEAVAEKQAENTNQTSSASGGSINLEGQWQKILEIIKKENNPLYTVLRLATPEATDGILTLIFNFPFHQKKVDEAKHKKTIAEAIRSITEADLEIVTIVDKSRARPPSIASSSQPDPAHASLISNVQDIMGGGEVVSI